MNKFHGIGLVILLAVTFAMVESAYGSVTFTNNLDTITSVAFSNTTDTNSVFMDSFETDTKEYLLWVDDTCDDLIFFGTTTDGITTSTPITINYIGGGCGVADQVVLNSGELAVSGNDVYVAWIEDTQSLTRQDMFLKHSSDNGLTFGIERTVVLGGNFTSTDINMVANTFDDVIIFYQNATTGNLENFVSHDDGATWAVKTVTGSGTVDEQSLKMIGNDIFVGGSSATFQKSTDAGDTWLGSAISLIGTGSAGIPFLFVNGTDVNLIYYDSAEADHEQARSINGGTSFVTSDLDLPLSTAQGCRAGTVPIGNFFVIADGDSVTFACTLSVDIDIKLIHSQDGSATWDAIQTLDTGIEQQSGSFVGYARDEITVLVWRPQTLTNERIAYSIDSLSASPSDSTWSLFPELYPNNEQAHSGGTVGMSESYPAMTRIGDRLIIVYDDSDFTDEQFAYSFVEPYCVTDLGFTCPFDVSLNSVVINQPLDITGVATTTGYHTIFQKNTSSDPHVYYASSPDAKSGTTPLNISGVLKDVNLGIIQSELHIFEDGAGTIDAFWIENHPTNNEAFHARSTNGGTSFSVKNSLTSGIDNIHTISPAVDGTNLGVAFLNGTSSSNSVPFFVESSNGGTSWNTSIDIEGGADECDIAQDRIVLTKESSSDNWYSVWYGINQTSIGNGICFNRSTDGGTTWGTTVLNLEDVTATSQPVDELYLLSSGTNIAVIWENVNQDMVEQSISSDSGATFGVETTIIDTIPAPCTDPSKLMEVIQDGTNIYVFCAGQGTHFKKSTNMGATYGSLTAIGGTVADPDGIAINDSIILAGRNGTLSKNTVAHSNDGGSTWDFLTDIFTENKLFDVVTGNATDVFVGFTHRTNYEGADNNYVSLGTFSTGIAPDTTPPVISITGDNPLEHLVNTTYTDAGAVCNDVVDGSLTVGVVSTVNSAVVGTYTVTYTCTDLSANQAQAVRTVNVVEQISTTVTTGGGAGAPVGSVIDTGVEGFTPEQQEAFDQAVANAIASIEPSEGNIVETIIQTFFEFIVVDKVHEGLQLQSFLDDQRLGFRWSTGDDLVIVSATPALSPFMFTFEQFPAIKQGSGAFVSTNFILYNLEVPRTECTATISVNCVEKIRYEIPVTVNAIINGTQVSDTGTITVDLTEDEIDPILLIILATAFIPIVAVIIQRSRGRSSVEPLKRVLS